MLRYLPGGSGSDEEPDVGADTGRPRPTLGKAPDITMFPIIRPDPHVRFGQAPSSDHGFALIWNFQASAAHGGSSVP
jgi:hypothetical protein